MKPLYCRPAKTVQKELLPGIPRDRAEFIFQTSTKWANGNVITYYFFDNDTDGSNLEGTTTWTTWKGSDALKEVVRKAFEIWKKIGIGLDFKEVIHREDAQVRIGFMQGDGSWSYVGTDVLTHKDPNERTMNFGWDITVADPGNGIGTAVHEIGHTIGLLHEHQSNKAGIEWNESAVYASLGAPPNSWSREMIYDNILKRVDAATTNSSDWDPNSIMEYPFEAGLINKPVPYQKGLFPPGVLSKTDIDWALKYYPPLGDQAPASLTLSQSVSVKVGKTEQEDFEFRPAETRYYNFQTFGNMDNKMLIFEKTPEKELLYLSADETGADKSSSAIKLKLFRNKEYLVKVRVYYKINQQQASIMVW